MNSSKIGLVAAAVAAAMGSTSAFALSPSATATAINAGDVVYTGGGSAQVNALLVALNSLFTSGTQDYFTDNTTGGNSANYLIISGSANATLAAALGVATGTNYVVEYRFSGGSFPNGGLPIAAPTTANALPFPTVTDLSAAVATGAAYPLPTFKYSSTYPNKQLTALGLTDTELPLFNFTDNLNGTAALSFSLLNGLGTAIYDDVEGVAITSALAGVKSNFSRAEVEGILAGTITTWTQLYGDNGHPLTNPSGQTGIYLLDRGSGSGTKAAGNAYFLEYPIATTSTIAGAASPRSVNAHTISNYTDTALVTSSGYQDVKEASSGAIVADLQKANTAGQYAIAILATEFPPVDNQVTTGTNSYVFAKIDGLGIDTGYDSTTTASTITGFFHDNINTPSKGNDANGHAFGTSYTNVINGSYDFFYQNSFNLPQSGPGATGLASAFASAIQTALSSPTLASANSGSSFPTSVAGVVLDPLTIGTPGTKGMTLYSRQANSAAPLQPIFDATSGAIVYGLDPL